MTFNNKANQEPGPFRLPELPYSKDSFKSLLTSEAFDYHHGKHHQAYVTNLNNLLKDQSEFTNRNLEEIIMVSSKDSKHAGVFNNAAQIWNHSFYWHSITPNFKELPDGALKSKIIQDFGNMEKFMEEFKQAAVSQFGSGWAWVVCQDNKLSVVKTSNAETPITKGIFPLLTCDVWEHAYYIDYRNRRPDYVASFIEKMLNWEFAVENYNYYLTSR